MSDPALIDWSIRNTYQTVKRVKDIQARGVATILLIDVLMPLLTPSIYRFLFRDGKEPVFQQIEPVVVGLFRLAGKVKVLWPLRRLVHRWRVHGAIAIEQRASSKPPYLKWDFAQRFCSFGSGQVSSEHAEAETY